jgi:hypothetical protein
VSQVIARRLAGSLAPSLLAVAFTGATACGGGSGAADPKAMLALLAPAGPGSLAGIELGASWTDVRSAADKRWEVFEDKLRFQTGGATARVSPRLDGDRVTALDVGVRGLGGAGAAKVLLELKARLAQVAPPMDCTVDTNTEARCAFGTYVTGFDHYVRTGARQEGLGATLNAFVTDGTLTVDVVVWDHRTPKPAR